MSVLAIDLGKTNCRVTIGDHGAVGPGFPGLADSDGVARALSVVRAAAASADGNPAEIRSAFDRSQAIDDFTAVAGKDLVITSNEAFHLDDLPRRIVVVGGGLAGAKTVEELRTQGYAGELTLVHREAHLPYERPPLSKDYLQGKAQFDDALVHPQSWYDEHDVHLVEGVATAIDLDAHEVQVEGGSTLGYDRLVLATGSTPRRLPLQLLARRRQPERAVAAHDTGELPHREAGLGGHHRPRRTRARRRRELGVGRRGCARTGLFTGSDQLVARRLRCRGGS